MSKHPQFWSAISQFRSDISKCWSGRHTINGIHYTQLTEAKCDVGQKLDDVRLQPVSGLTALAIDKPMLLHDQFQEVDQL